MSPITRPSLRFFALGLSGLGCCCLALAVQAATNMTPLVVTGFNRDLVIENTASGTPYSSYALEFNPGEGTAFYQSGLLGTTYGLPVSGSVTSALGDGTVFQFQPYTKSNALVLSSETGLTSGTLTLQATNKFSRIAILANSASANASSAGTLTLHFSDGTTFVTNYSAPDWFSNPGFALQGVDRINISSGATDGGPNGDPRFYQTTVNLAAALGATNKPLVSLTFGKASSANATAIYAVSGLPTSAITLPVVTNTAASNIQARFATVGGQVTATGGETPAITLFYGTTDGGTNPVNWQQTVALGLQGGAFSQTLSGLTPNTLYYFTCRAVNSAGTNWATPSGSFSTVPLTLAAITNQPANNVQATLATLNGQVLATGGDTPSVTVYYGTSDGGSNPAAWAHSVALGIQTAGFAQTVTGLSPTTTYFFTASAVNGAGTAWAAPSQTFTTQLTNTPSSLTAVTTHHNDNARSGMNLNESLLNTGNVNTNTFGLVGTLPVDDQIYAQPLVMTNVNVLGRGTHNVVLVCTVNDSVYAFDADNPSASVPYWQDSFIGTFGGTNVVPLRNTDMDVDAFTGGTGACGGNYHDFSGNMGIVGAPVIDTAAGTMYVVVRTKETTATTTNFVQRLHALDITSGAERPNSPVVIAATNSGVVFNPYYQNQRPALLLANGYVYISWSSHCDYGPYHGWVIGYKTANLLQPPLSFNCNPTGSQVGIWMSNQGPAADPSGNVYLSTGNGTWDGVSNFGESFLKLTNNGTGLSLATWFTPYNWNSLNGGDVDLGSGGLLLIPGTTLALSGGKEGILYLVNRDNMGGVTSSTTTNDNIIQSFVVTTDEIHGGPVWWDGPTNSCGYIWPASVHLQQYVFNRAGGLFELPVFSQGPTAAPSGQPGGILSLSAFGTNAGSAIVWAAHQLNGDANQQVLPGILHAYDARNVTNELWNSGQNSARDAVGNFAKFVPPTVANGKVYLATFSSRLDVYGLLPTAQLAVSPPTLSFGTVAVGSNAQASFLITNQGGTALTNGVATLSAGPFTLVSGTPFSLPASGSTNLVVRFAPGSTGTFTNTVIITSGNGGNSTNLVTGTAAAVPVASFTASPTNGLAPLAVTFTDNSTGTITNRFWNFGDGSISNTTLTSVAHTYNAAGTNTVVLTVTGPVGTNTQTRSGYIVVTNLPPLLSLSPTNLNFGLLATGLSSTQSFQVVNAGGTTLTGAVTTTLPFSIASGTPFSLSPGQTGLVQVAFSPSSVGNFTNLVNFTSNGGNDTNTVTGSAAAVPLASFTAGPTNGLAPLAVTFTDNSTGTITNRFWNFGDGSVSNTTLTSVAHIYNTAGTNTVVLTVTGPVGTNIQTRSGYIVVTNLPPLLSLSPTNLNFGLLATGLSSTQSFQVVNSGGTTLTGAVATTLPFSVASGTPFSLSPGQTGLVQVAFSPSSVGGFTNLVTFTSNGGNDTNTVTGSAAAVPLASFTAGPTNGLAPLAVTFTDSSTGTITNRFWNFGDGSVSNTTLTSVAHTYNTAGTNTVVLTVTGPVGTNIQTRSGYIVVTNLPPLLSLSPTNLNFGLLATGLSSTQSFQVVNSGGTTLTGAVATTLPFSVASGTPFSLSPGQTGLVQVAFSPSSVGNFTNLVTFTSNGGKSTNTVAGSAAAVPLASFTASPTSGTWPLTVPFTDNSTGTITNSFWDFGDGATTNTLPGNLTHTYVGVGTNTVVLRVTGPVGTNTQTRSAYILVTNPAPVTITIQWVTNHVLLTWPEGTLQSSLQVTGTYTNITAATSPYTVTPAEATRFFRIKVR